MGKGKILTGKCHLFSETGTEGGYWAFQDSRFIKPNTTQFSCKKCYIVWDKEKNPNGPAPIPLVEGSKAVVLDRIIPLTKETCKKGYKLPRECSAGKHQFELTTKEFYLDEGLHFLEDNDYLIIYSPKNPKEVVWEGRIALRQYPSFKENALGLWIHADQKGIERNKWAEYFFKEYPAKLIKKQKNRR